MAPETTHVASENRVWFDGVFGAKRFPNRVRWDRFFTVFRNRTPGGIGQARCRKPLGRSRTTPIRIYPIRSRTNPSRSRTNSEWSRTRLRANGARSESLVRFGFCSIRLRHTPPDLSKNGNMQLSLGISFHKSHLSTKFIFP